MLHYKVVYFFNEKKVEQKMEIHQITEDINSIKIKHNIGDTVNYVAQIFENAIKIGASDIHIEPTKHYLLIRFRKDGDFVIYDKIDTSNNSAVITRLKVLSQIKIDENKKPQDGKITFQPEELEQAIDIRLSTLPTKYGEKVVMRILKQDDNLNSIADLGFIDVNLKKILTAVKSTYGIILTTGPTGSGKSTTLFGILKDYNPLEYNISTLEDPIEYNIELVNQSQVKPDIGYTFASGLRSLVRQDPDIIMVWEIRDTETASLAVEAALTGHLVYSTLHTNSAAATIQRLINMGIEPFLLASAIKLIISQRLGKRICSHCKQEEQLSEVKMQKVQGFLKDLFCEEELANLKFYKGAWCEHCSGTGYKGRVAFHEVLPVWPYLEDPILKKDSANTIKNIAVEHGMITIVQDALIKGIMGQTTVDEALKLI